MKAPSPTGFTLIEVLIAVSLAGGVTALALLLLHTTRQVSTELRQPIRTTGDHLPDILREEMDHLLPESPFENQPSLEISPEGGLVFVTLREGPDGIPHPTRVHYLQEGRSLTRITEGGIPLQAATTLVTDSILRFRVRAFQDGAAYEVWPTNSDSTLPGRIELEWKQASEPERITSFAIPAAFRIEKPTED